MRELIMSSKNLVLDGWCLSIDKGDSLQFQTKWELGHHDMSWAEQNDCGVLPLIPQSVQTELS